MTRKPIFEHGNCWNNESTGVDGFSNIVDLKEYDTISIHGSIPSDTEISFYVSTDGINFDYCNQISTQITPSQPPGASTYPKYFHTFVSIGARYVRLQSTNDVIMTATIEGKDWQKRVKINYRVENYGFG